MIPAVLLVAAAWAADGDFPPVVEDTPSGRINWTELRLEVTARSDRTVGAWKDRRVQEQDAVDRLAPMMTALAEQVSVTPSQQADDLMDADEDLGRRLKGSLSDWRVSETRYQAGGGVEMDAALDLEAWLQPALQSLARPGEAPEPSEGPTGIVIDARGLSYSPSMAPTVLLADGTVVARAQVLAAGTLRLRSPVLYVTDPADPRAAERAGVDPLFAQATAVQGGGLVLAAASAAGVHPDLPKLVAGGRVVLVVETR